MKQGEKKYSLKRWFLLCPVRHILTLLGLVLIAGYFLLRGSTNALAWIYRHFTAPLHSILSRACGLVRFSVAEVLIYAAVVIAVVYLVTAIVLLIRRRKILVGIYRIIVTALMAFCLIYGGFCLLWGVYYAVADFEEESGIQRSLVSTEQLETVTRYFAEKANYYGEMVERDEDGLFAEPLDSIFDKSADLYEDVVEEFQCLDGANLRCKPFHFSKLMSYIQFTGFFFPFTAEANINIDSPACLIPSTIAHELAHQRGVAAEDEANFVAVLASMENGDPVYCYSASLLAYIHLGNALNKADYDAWSEVYGSLSDGVIADLKNNNAYWAQYKTPVSTVSDAVYTGFLQSYGQTEGLKTYGACVDLLIAYYYDIAAAQ